MGACGLSVAIIISGRIALLGSAEDEQGGDAWSVTGLIRGGCGAGGNLPQSVVGWSGGVMLSCSRA
jgi:hypothetical protein